MKTSSKKEEEYFDIILTDIQLHITKPRNPVSAGRAMVKALKENRPGRFFKRGLPVTKDGKIILPIFKPVEIAELEEKAKREGKKVRFFIHKSGLPILAGKDVAEYIKAKEKKALDRARR